MAKIEVKVSLLNSNFNSQKNNFFIHILVKSLEDRIATLHTFGRFILQISRTSFFKTRENQKDFLGEENHKSFLWKDAGKKFSNKLK